MLRLLTALFLGGATTLGTFWLMLQLTSGTPGKEPPRLLSSIDFIRLPDTPEPPRPPRDPPEPPRPPEEVPEITLVTPQVPQLQLSGLRLRSLDIPVLAATQEIVGMPFLGDQPEPLALPQERSLGILKRIPPIYPARALMRKIEGWVRLELTIDPQGQVAEARVLDASPKGVFDQAALKAARRWRFQPATEGGRERSVRVSQKIEFRLER
jgi:protein TonB